jgi:hypothetical protein
MSNALCICPDFIGSHITNPVVYAKVFMGSIAITDCQVVLDKAGRLEYEYSQLFKDDVPAFTIFKVWWSLIKDAIGSGKLLAVPVDDFETGDHVDIVYRTISSAATIFNKSIVAYDNNTYGRYVSELQRQHIALINMQNLSMDTDSIFMRKNITYHELDFDLSWVLQRLARDHDIGKSENAKNDYVRSMMMAKEYNVLDQTREGDSSTGVDAGEIDILVNDNRGQLFTIIEALKLSSVDSGKILEHYLKLLHNYNPLQVQRTFLVTYYDGNNFEQWWGRYILYVTGLTINDINLSEGAAIVSVEPVTTQYPSLKKLIHQFTQNGENFSCIHYAIKVSR